MRIDSDRRTVAAFRNKVTKLLAADRTLDESKPLDVASYVFARMCVVVSHLILPFGHRLQCPHFPQCPYCRR